MRTIGAVYTPARPLDYFEPTALTTHFDALLHLDTVSPTHLRD
jgi:erythromycin esterase-like protein